MQRRKPRPGRLWGRGALRSLAAATKKGKTYGKEVGPLQQLKEEAGDAPGRTLRSRGTRRPSS